MELRSSLTAWIAPLRKAAALLLAILVACGVVLWGLENATLVPYLSRLGWLKLDEVKITAEWPVTAAQVRAWLPPLEGKSILLVKPRVLMDVLEAKPWVESVTIKKEYPNRLVIDVGTKRAQALYVHKSQAHFLDTRGRLIEKATPALLATLDLPVISVESLEKWDLASQLHVLERLQRALEPTHRLSEMSLGAFPYFRIFLQPTRTEVLFNLDNYESQIPKLLLLLQRPPAGIGKPTKINLIFPKKTIVSSSISN